MMSWEKVRSDVVVMSWTENRGVVAVMSWREVWSEVG